MKKIKTLILVAFILSVSRLQAAPTSPKITTSSLPGGTQSAAYSATLTASRGTTPYTWSLSGGSLPAGLSLSSSGTISGTPTSVGSFSFTVRVRDGAGRTASATLGINIGPAPLQITTNSLPGGTQSAAYSATLTASGGTTPYTWSLSGGSLPTGLSLSSSGTISGTPTTVGSFSFSVQVRDGAGRTASKTLSINIGPPPPQITTNSLPGGTQSAAYSATLTASGGTTPYTWSLSGGSLPAGLSLSSSGTISGTPTTVGSFSFTVQMRDVAGRTASKTLSINIGPAAGDPRALSGEWSPVFSWNGEVGIHMHMLPNGKVLSWQDDNDPNYYVNGTRTGGKTVAQLWDVSSGTFVNIPYSNTDLFCSGHSFLADGRLLILGGQEQYNGVGSVDTNVFDYTKGANGQWIGATPMAAARWYGSACTLATGEVLTVSGVGNIGNPDFPEVWQDGSGWRTLTSAQLHIPYYPSLHLAPDGRVFISGPTQTTYYMNASGSGSWVKGPLANFALPRVEGTSVMYDVGKVIIIGGGDPPTATAEVIDLLSSTPTWRSVNPMGYPRRHLNATILPDGKVIVIGGTSSPGYNDSAGAVHAAEIWDPGTEKWSTLASMQVNRLYHSTALLLPDGRILTAGGGRPAAAGEDPYSEHDDAQIFSPPYLFKGPRPVITLAPNAVTYNGQPFFVQTPDAANITAVNWVRLSSVTHGHNFNQRFNRLTFSKTAGGLNVNAPTDSKLCPPGDYILFILNGNGVPSVGRIMRIN